MWERNSRPPAKIDNPDAAPPADVSSLQPPVGHGAKNDTAQEGWEVVPLPGLFIEPSPLDSIDQDSTENIFMEGQEMSELVELPSPEDIESRLLSHMQDLNQCNEVLLSRVSQLEEALERSQQALQLEVERSHRVHAEHPLITAQSQSVAQLLRDLEHANETAQRQTLLAETLAAQLQTFQERSQHLEKECALLRKQHADVSEQLRLSEATCADLRSRLQRQQQYTLQFKAALEKSVGSTTPPSTIAWGESTRVESAATSNPLIMPRAERIQPWSAKAMASPADQQLLSLVRSSTTLPEDRLPSDWLTTDDAAPVQSSPKVSPPVPDPEPMVSISQPEPQPSTAEQQLWQDVEQVMQATVPMPTPNEVTSTEPETEVAPLPIEMPPESVSAQEDDIETEALVQFTEPIPWGVPIAQPKELVPSASPDVVATPEIARPSAEITDPKGDRSAEETASTPVHRPPQVPDAYRYTDTASRIPALNVMQMAHSSPSPIVHPLRPPTTRRKSLSAVELPSFPPLPKVTTQETAS